MAIVAKYSLNWNANDSAGSNNGTATNISWVGWKSGQAGSFNWSNSYINLWNVFNFSWTTNFSISALIYYTWDAWHIISKFAPWISGQWTFTTSDSNTFGMSREVAPFSLNSSGVLNINQWNYIVWTYNWTAMRLYHNWILVAWPQNSWSIASNTRNVRIWSNDNNWDYYNWLIDEIEVHNIALSATEIKNKYLYYNWFM